jgi:maltooligosyltrehalose trehalohydrolase
VNYDDANSDDVRRYVLDNARYWIDEFHLDGLRLDAVHAIYDMSARHILDALGEAVHAQAAAAGRTALVIAESDLNDPRLVRDRSRGGFGLDAQWSDDFHHALHVTVTGERQGYYADFDGPHDLARTLRDRWVYDGRRSRVRRRRHGAPATDLPRDRFVVCAQNHDQVGNRARGERLATLVDPPRLRLAAALVLLAPFVPLLFMGEEWGETNPFLYFTSHGDPALAQAVRDGRRREFADFAWAGPVPDPQAEETFRASRPDPRRAAEPGHRELLALHRNLLRVRRDRFAAAWDAPLEVTTGPADVWIRLDAGAEVPVRVFNVSDQPHAVPLGADGPWRLVLTTAAACYGGDGDAAVDGDVLRAPAWTAAVLTRGVA